MLVKKQDYLFKCTCVLTGIVTTVVFIGFHLVAAMIVMSLLIAGDVAVCNNFFGICGLIPTRFDEDIEQIKSKIADTQKEATDLKAPDGKDILPLLPANGEEDGQWVRNKYICGYLSLVSEGVYELASVGTAF